MSSRDFSTISPSAKALLLVKAQTTVPYARPAAEILFGREAVDEAARETAAKPEAAARRRHFELRARSLDDALEDLGATRVLEVAAGLSFRGLAMAERSGVFYLDTDLPEIAAIKSTLLPSLHPAPLAGTLRIQALDALDAVAFRAAVAGMPTGPIAVVHEGLLMYLDDGEKARLASCVREALLERGGAWITADVYVRSRAPVYREERTKAFLEAHRVEEKKFADLAAAESFFTSHGFSVERTIAPEADPWSVRQTWVLTARSGALR
ncbi:MAG TPA: class I SAM-dependent methyltransferase [Polyangiaceae bacterium]